MVVFPSKWILFGLLSMTSIHAFLLPSLPQAPATYGSSVSTPLQLGVNNRIHSIQPLNIFPERDNEKLTRENEPDQYFRTNLDDKSTKEKFNDPLVLIGIGSIFLPFILVALLFSSGYLTR